MGDPTGPGQHRGDVNPLVEAHEIHPARDRELEIDPGRSRREDLNPVIARIGDKQLAARMMNSRPLRHLRAIELKITAARGTESADIAIARRCTCALRIQQNQRQRKRQCETQHTQKPCAG